MAKYITQGTIEKIIVDTQSGGKMRIQIAPSQDFRIEACGKTAIVLAEANEEGKQDGNSNKKEWTVDLAEVRNSLLVPEDSGFGIANISIAELIALKNNGNKIELRLREEYKEPERNYVVEKFRIL